MALWQNLKGKKLFGFRFLRQHLIVYQVVGQECFYYVADFYCNRARLVVELDGGIHDTKQQREKDYNRDQIIKSLGLRVLRIRNEELFNMPAVLEKKTNPARASRSIKYNSLAGAPPLPILGLLFIHIFKVSL
jgi:very-short-patch-repair endonuclease